MALKVMIVDDNRVDREGLQELVNWDVLECQVVGMASNGQEGYEKIMKLKPDLVITDISMPVLNGIEMVKRIKSEYDGCKYIFMSCYEEFTYIKSVLDMGENNYILKPIIIDNMTKIIMELKQTIKKEHDDAKLREYYDNNIESLKEQVAREILLLPVLNDDKQKERLDILRYERGMGVALVRVFIDSFYELAQNLDKKYSYYYINEVKSLFQKNMPDNNSVISLVHNKSSLTMLLFLPKKCGDATDFTLETINMLKEKTESVIDYSLTFLIGGITDDIEKLPEFYETTEYVVKRGFSFIPGSVILLDKLIIDLDVDYPIEISGIALELENIFYDESRNFDEFFDKYIKSDVNASEVFIRSFSLMVVGILEFLLQRRGTSFQKIFGDQMLVQDKLYRLETIYDIKQWLKNIFNICKESSCTPTE